MARIFTADRVDAAGAVTVMVLASTLGLTGFGAAFAAPANAPVVEHSATVVSFSGGSSFGSSGSAGDVIPELP